jgi:L-asparaginase II
MLATCRARGWPTEGYRLAGHPLQDEIHAEVAAAAEVAAGEIETGVDGCGVVCFSLPLERVALMFSRLEGRDGGDRVAAAMREHPQLVGGAGQLDTQLMQAAPGWLAKGGAEGLLGAGGPGGVGVAMKVADGNFRALRPALPVVLAELGESLDPELGRAEVRNSRGEVVGELVARG